MSVEKNLVAAYPYLTPCGIAARNVDVAKNIRATLKHFFKGVKFSVRATPLTIDVSWTDGPIQSVVLSKLNKFKGGYFDGMTDCYEYEYESNDFSNTFGHTNFLSVKRHFSDELLDHAVLLVEKERSVKVTRHFNQTIDGEFAMSLVVAKANKLILVDSVWTLTE
ncbi:LPD29 domain-containing protein [Aeromonas salmonicida]|uniref:LPD29 domain-containing protein n=1 Tax=Aeromonas salmonicida TaxID=645 RepID=UPI003CFEC653